MYKIEKKPWGFQLTFGGQIAKPEMEKWKKESEQTLSGPAGGTFGVLIDMRTLKPLPPDAQEVMVSGQQAYKKAGMIRSAVILEDVITTMQFKRLAQTSGIYQWERYISAAQTPNWEPIAVAWVKDGTDPDK